LHGLTVMHRFGQLAVYLGILLVAVGLIGGFAAMFRDADDLAVNLLVLVPLGFVALLTGVVVTQLHRPGNQR
jgi:cytochrome bd-type quinol oxidase subunit 1